MVSIAGHRRVRLIGRVAADLLPGRWIVEGTRVLEVAAHPAWVEAAVTASVVEMSREALVEVTVAPGEGTRPLEAARWVVAVFGRAALGARPVWADRGVVAEGCEVVGECAAVVGVVNR